MEGDDEEGEGGGSGVGGDIEAKWVQARLPPPSASFPPACPCAPPNHRSLTRALAGTQLVTPLQYLHLYSLVLRLSFAYHSLVVRL